MLPAPPAPVPAAPAADASPERSPPGLVPFGTTLETKNYRIALTASHPCDDIESIPALYGADKTIFAVEVAMEAKRGDGFLHRVVGVKDGDGRLYAYGISGPFGRCTPRLEDVTIRAGEKLRGWIFILVPKDAKPTELDIAIRLGWTEEDVLRLALPPSAGPR